MLRWGSRNESFDISMLVRSAERKNKHNVLLCETPVWRELLREAVIPDPIGVFALWEKLSQCDASSL